MPAWPRRDDSKSDEGAASDGTPDYPRYGVSTFDRISERVTLSGANACTNVFVSLAVLWFVVFLFFVIFLWVRFCVLYGVRSVCGCMCGNAF